MSLRMSGSPRLGTLFIVQFDGPAHRARRRATVAAELVHAIEHDVETVVALHVDPAAIVLVDARIGAAALRAWLDLGVGRHFASGPFLYGLLQPTAFAPTGNAVHTALGRYQGALSHPTLYARTRTKHHPSLVFRTVWNDHCSLLKLWARFSVALQPFTPTL